MPKESHKENKRAQPEIQPQNGIAEPERNSPMQINETYAAEYSNELAQAEDEIKQIKIAFDSLETYEQGRDTHIEALKDFVEDKLKMISSIQENFRDVKIDYKTIAVNFENAANMYFQAEMEQSNNFEKYLARIHELEATGSNFNKIMMAKEAECAAYLNELKTKYDELTENVNQLQNEKNELLTKVADLEAKLHEHQQAAEDYKENLEKAQDGLEKKAKKLLKKEGRIKELKEKLNNLEAEKKEFEEKFDIQSRKMRELQSVLDRPYQLITPVKELDSNEVQVETVMPIVASVEPTVQSSAISSPEIIENTQRSNHNDEMNNSLVLRTRSARMQQSSYMENVFANNELSGGSSPNNEPQTARVSAQRVNKRTLPYDFSDDDDDDLDMLMFPPYVPHTATQTASGSSSKRSKK